MTQVPDSLARLSLRQLRYKASDLGVPLYSRKTKDDLIREISMFEKNKKDKQVADTAFWRAPNPSDLESDEAVNNQNSEIKTRVVFLPRDPEWAYVFWEISESDRKTALSQGANRLCIRLADVTGITDGTAHRQALQEILLDSHSTEWYLPIPMSDRDYRVELGYRFDNSWISLAFSQIAKVPSMYPSDQILDEFVPFSLKNDSNTEVIEEEKNISVDQVDRGLHESLYQTARNPFKTLRSGRSGSEEFHEYGTDEETGLTDSGFGVWASGRNESGLGFLPSSNKTFWLIADSELVIYGSTDPSAKLTIGGQEIPLSNEGTFRLQVPFRDGIQNYPIEATDKNGDQKRNITMKFERVTPQDNTNPNDPLHTEWF